MAESGSLPHGYKRVPPPPSAPDQDVKGVSWKDLAEKEAKAILHENLDEHARHREHRRTQRFKDSLNYVAVGAIWILALAVLASVVFWFWHLLLPTSIHFLADDQIRKIETVVFSGLVVGIAQRYLSKHID